MAGVDADVVTARVHRELYRVVGGVRLVGPGTASGCRTKGPPGARWALLGLDVEFRRTAYDVAAAVALMRATDDPRVEAERRVFAG
jgi:hypothetical protein